MTTRLITLVTLLAALAGCGKKTAESSASTPSEKPKSVSAEALLNQPSSDQPAAAAPPEAPPPPAAEAPKQDTGAPAGPVDFTQVNPKREDMMEKWLDLYQRGDANQKAQVIKEVKAAKLTAAERALMENTRSRYGYPKIPAE